MALKRHGADDPVKVAVPERNKTPQKVPQDSSPVRRFGRESGSYFHSPSGIASTLSFNHLGGASAATCARAVVALRSVFKHTAAAVFSNTPQQQGPGARGGALSEGDPRRNGVSETRLKRRSVPFQCLGVAAAIALQQQLSTKGASSPRVRIPPHPVEDLPKKGSYAPSGFL